MSASKISFSRFSFIPVFINKCVTRTLYSYRVKLGSKKNLGGGNCNYANRYFLENILVYHTFSLIF